MRETTDTLRRVETRADTVELQSAGSRYWTQEDFEITGVNVALGTVTVRGGTVTGFGLWAAIADAKVSVGGTEAVPHWICAEGNPHTPTGTIAALSTQDYPTHGEGDDGPWKLALYKVWFTSAGNIKLRRCRPVDVKSWLGS